MKTYKTRGEAVKASIEDEQFYVEAHFCPLIKGNCVSNCVSFKRYDLVKDEKKRWSLIGYMGCNNDLLI